MKELPKMYHNKINKEVNNNERMFTTMYRSKEEKKEHKIVNDKSIEQKIYDIFNSPNYIYKIDVVIVTDDNKVNKRIVGKTKTNLITIDNEYIPINTIRDIYISR